jgi:mitogen-activated protein kinase organizer 1
MTLTEARDSVSTVAVVDHEIMSGSVDGRLRTYDIRMGMVYADLIGRMFAFFCCVDLAGLGCDTNKWFDVIDPITSISPLKQNDSILVSTLDSKLRLMDKTNGKLLQAFTSTEVRFWTVQDNLGSCHILKSSALTSVSIPIPSIEYAQH